MRVRVRVSLRVRVRVRARVRVKGKGEGKGEGEGEGEVEGVVWVNVRVQHHFGLGQHRRAQRHAGARASERRTPACKGEG